MKSASCNNDQINQNNTNGTDNNTTLHASTTNTTQSNKVNGTIAASNNSTTNLKFKQTFLQYISGAIHRKEGGLPKPKSANFGKQTNFPQRVSVFGDPGPPEATCQRRPNF